MQASTASATTSPDCHAMNADQVQEAAALERIEAEFIATLKAARLALGYKA